MHHMKKEMILILVLIILFCASCSNQSATQIKSADSSRNIDTTQEIATFSSDIIYKLPSKIIYTDPDDTESFEAMNTHKWEFDFSSKEPTKEDVYCLTFNEQNLIEKSFTIDKSSGNVTETDFEYNSQSLISKITYPDGRVDEFSYSDNNRKITAVTKTKSEESTAIITINENGNILSCENLSNNNYFALSGSVQYDEYYNVINENNSVYQFPLENIEYSNENIVGADICSYKIGESNNSDNEKCKLKIEYDNDDYPVQMKKGNSTFDFYYSEYTQEEYIALKKLSVVWLPASFQYYNQALPIYVNYYRN